MYLVGAFAEFNGAATWNTFLGCLNISSLSKAFEVNRSKVLNGKVACLPFSEQKAKVKEGDNASHTYLFVFRKKIFHKEWLYPMRGAGRV